MSVNSAQPKSLVHKAILNRLQLISSTQVCHDSIFCYYIIWVHKVNFLVRYRSTHINMTTKCAILKTLENFGNWLVEFAAMLDFFLMYNKFIINNTGQCYKVVTKGQRKRKEADIQMQLSLTENE